MIEILSNLSSTYFYVKSFEETSPGNFSYSCILTSDESVL